MKLNEEGGSLLLTETIGSTARGEYPTFYHERPSSHPYELSFHGLKSEKYGKLSIISISNSTAVEAGEIWKFQERVNSNHESFLETRFSQARLKHCYVNGLVEHPAPS